MTTVLAQQPDAERPEGAIAMFKNWAQPVTNRPWAVVATVLEKVKIASGYRLVVGTPMVEVQP